MLNQIGTVIAEMEKITVICPKNTTFILSQLGILLYLFISFLGKDWFSLISELLYLSHGFNLIMDILG